MADNEKTEIKKAEVTEMVEKKENKFFGWIKRNANVIVGVSAGLSAGLAIGYIACKATHYESNNVVDDVVENLTPEVSETVSDTVPTPEIDDMTNPEV